MLCFVDPEPRTTRLCNTKWRMAQMQLQLSFMEEPRPGSTPIWETLDNEQRSDVVTTLGRLIAKTAGANSEARADSDKEDDDE